MISGSGLRRKTVPRSMPRSGNVGSADNVYNIGNLSYLETLEQSSNRQRQEGAARSAVKPSYETWHVPPSRTSNRGIASGYRAQGVKSDIQTPNLSQGVTAKQSMVQDATPGRALKSRISSKLKLLDPPGLGGQMTESDYPSVGPSSEPYAFVRRSTLPGPVGKVRWMKAGPSPDFQSTFEDSETPVALLLASTSIGSAFMDRVQLYGICNFSSSSYSPAGPIMECLCSFPLRRKPLDLAEIEGSATENTIALFAAGTSGGSVEVFQIGSNFGKQPRKANAIFTLGDHLFRPGEAVVGTCNIAENHGKLAAAGSSGSLAVFDVESQSLTWSSISSPESDVMGYLCCSSLESWIVAAGTSCGRVNLWDIRTRSSEGHQPSTSGFADQTADATSASELALLHPSMQSRIRCVASDPHNNNYVFAGTHLGELAIWDRRRAGDPILSSCYPASRTAAHRGVIWDTRVVPGRPATLLTCGEDGNVLLWQFAAAAARGLHDGTDVWLGRVSGDDVQIVSEPGLAAINSVDVSDELLAYGTDTGSVAVQLLP